MENLGNKHRNKVTLDIDDPGERLRRRIEVEGVFLPIMNMCCLHYYIEKGGGKESCCDQERGAFQPLL